MLEVLLFQDGFFVLYLCLYFPVVGWYLWSGPVTQWTYFDLFTPVWQTVTVGRAITQT